MIQSSFILKPRVIIICLAFSQRYWNQLPVKPDLAEYQYFTWSGCLPDLHNPLTGVTRYFMARLESDLRASDYLKPRVILVNKTKKCKDEKSRKSVKGTVIQR
ncbi:hypothetical protein PYW07_008305 [Mythimna separata]|uniref:Uncharacterized protein n=1 Tax=Mythimna separata TaxID=271217 RepID=A0AAD8DNU8_MYTSE|nr:hypothetical protein PYW07_008304 [Mythimna separata]KAJ8711063.1 hypothetical protein PYW07_008305 [Mythimna separata]